MDSSMKTNRLAIISFVSSLVAIVSVGLIFVLYNSQNNSRIFIDITDGIIMPIRNLCIALALITGILALRDIKKKEGAEKGRILAWIGICLSAAWIIFGLGVGVSFLMGEILH